MFKEVFGEDGGQRGIRTPGELPHGRVPGDWIKPLSHLPILDKAESIAILCLCGN